jgi:hypothetical protein
MAPKISLVDGEFPVEVLDTTGDVAPGALVVGAGDEVVHAVKTRLETKNRTTRNASFFIFFLPYFLLICNIVIKLNMLILAY